MLSIRMCWGTGGSDAKKKTGRERPVFSLLKLRGLSELLVRGGGCAVDRFLGGFLGIAQRLLALALHLLDRALALQAVGTNGLANALLGLADGFVGRALDLVAGSTHETFSFLDFDKPTASA